MVSRRSWRRRRAEVSAPFRKRRPLTRLALGGLAGHVFFELAAGVGMPLASVIGPLPAAAVWAIGAGGVWRRTRSCSASADAELAVFNGLGLAAVTAHLAGWPTRRSRTGLPWLEDCEGLGPELMRWYNPIIYVSGVSALLAILRENRAAPARLPILMFGLVPLLVAAQHAEHRRLVAQARHRPSWWTRRLREPTPS